MKIVRTAFVYLEKDEQVLLLQEGGRLAHGLWSLPGGHVDDGETFEEGAIREALEESGYAVRLNGVIWKRNLPGQEYKGHPDDHDKEIELAVFKAEIINGELKKDSEALDLKWFIKSEISELPLRWDFIKEIVK
jgi:8-oxo-dGTP diphosphatase